MNALEYTKLSEKKRAELIESLRAGEVSDPVTMMLVSMGVSIGVSLLSSRLAPKAPMQQIGLMKGIVQIQNSQQGIFIPEIYGAAPSVALVPGTAVTWADKVNSTTGANGKIYKSNGSSPIWGQIWDSAAVDATAVQDADNAFIRFVPDSSVSTFMAVAAGFSTDTTPASGLGVGGAPAFEFGVICAINQTGTDASSNPIFSAVFAAVINGVRAPDLGTWTSVDEFRAEKRGGAYHLYKGFSEVTIPNPPTPSATLYIAYSGWRTNYGLATAYDKIGGDIGPPPSAGSGGCKAPAMTVWAVPPQKHSYISNTPTHGGKGHQSTQVENVFYTIDWRLNFARGPLDLIREYGNTDILMHQDPNLAQPSAIYNAGAGPATVYDPATPPNPIPGDNIGFLLRDGSLVEDGVGGNTGTIQNGSSGIAVYDGSTTQDIDPTEEAAVDAANGINSTPAHRGVAGIVHSGLNLQRWQNLPPNVTAVWQHQSLKLLGAIYESLCLRMRDKDGVALLTSDDYDFSSIAAVVCRGMLLDGRRFSPQEILDNEEIQDFYNYFTTEGDGKILAYLNGTEPSITIPESDIGWLDGASTMGETFQTISVTIGDDTKKPKQVDLKYINPGNDWEPDSASTMRKVTNGNLMESLQVQVTGNPDEARTATERRLYRKHVGDPVRFNLTWEYLYLYAGYRITVNTAAGITYIIRLTSITGGLGVRDCEGILLEPAAFSQAAVGPETPLYNPAHPKPAATILAAIDLPAFRPEDEGKFGMSFALCPRSTDLQTWNGAALFIKRGGAWIKLEEFSAPAIMGRIAIVTGTLETDPNTTDSTSVITVDLYGTKVLLESVTEANMIAGLNRAVFGTTIGGFATANRLANFPNRWEVSILRNGQNYTDKSISTIAAGQSFVLLNQAVKFVELDLTKDYGSTLFMRAVSFGQSLPDAAELEVPWFGQSARAQAMSDQSTYFDGNHDLLIEAVPHTKPYEVPATFSCLIWPDGTYTGDPKVFPMALASTHASLLASTSVDLVGDTIVSGHADGNNLIGGQHDPADMSSSRVPGITLEAMNLAYARFDFTIRWSGKNGRANWIGTDGPVVCLQTLSDINPPYTPDPSTAPLSVGWEAFGDAAGNVIGGTVKEVWRSFGEIIAERYNIDPGFSFSLDLPTFITTFYQAVLVRDPTGSEMSAAISTIQTSMGLDIIAAAGVIASLFNSADYIARGRSVPQFIDDLYLAYEQRISDAPGAAFWLDVYNNDVAAHDAAYAKAHLIDAFGLSIEFRLLISDVGLKGGRPGPRYTIILSGTEYRGYVSYAQGKAYTAKVASPVSGYPFPLRLVMAAGAAPANAGPIDEPAFGDGTCIINVVTGTTQPSTIVSRADQIAVYGVPPDNVYVELFQNGKSPQPDGFPLRLTARFV